MWRKIRKAGEISIIERDKLRLIADDPELSRAMVIIAGAKEEAGKIVTGESEEAIKRRRAIQSRILGDIIEREGLSGKPKTNRETPAGPKTAL